MRLALLVLGGDKTEKFLRNVCALTHVYTDLHQMVFPCLVMEFLPDHLATFNQGLKEKGNVLEKT